MSLLVLPVICQFQDNWLTYRPLRARDPCSSWCAIGITPRTVACLPQSEIAQGL